MICGEIKDHKMIVLDTSAWVEYLEGSKIGKIVNEYVTDNEILTPSIVLVELSCKSEKEKWNFEEILRFIKSKSLIIGLTENTIIKCGNTYVNQRKIKSKFGIIDAIILTLTKENNAKILTKNNDFSNINEAIMLK
jgi:predicted nucleic acid-binding protein